MRTIALALIVLGTLARTANGNEITADRPDSCRAQLPKSLIAAVDVAFKGYRAPLESDNRDEDVQYNRTHGGTGCLGVASGDFYGNREKDYLLGLTAKDGPTGLAVIARPSKAGWKFQKIRSWNESFRESQFVSAVPPGNYERTEALEGPVSGNERLSMKCPHTGALVGKIESADVIYCYIGREWLYVWNSD